MGHAFPTVEFEPECAARPVASEIHAESGERAHLTFLHETLFCPKGAEFNSPRHRLGKTGLDHGEP